MVKIKSPLGNLRAAGHPELRDVVNLDYCEPYDVGLLVKSDVDKVEDSLFDMIFSVDPVTKLPQGDVAVFMSQNTSADVRDFISRNLMREQTFDDGSTFDLDDDDIVKYSRGADESAESYRYRIFNVLREDILSQRKKQSEKDASSQSNQ